MKFVLVFAALVGAACGSATSAANVTSPNPAPTATTTIYGGSSFLDMLVFRPSSDRRQASLEVWYVPLANPKITHLLYSLSQQSSRDATIQYAVRQGRSRKCASLKATFKGEQELDLSNGGLWRVRLGRMTDDMISASLSALRWDAMVEAKSHRRGQQYFRLPSCAPSA